MLDAVPQELLREDRDFYLPVRPLNDPLSEESNDSTTLQVAVNLAMPKKYIMLLFDYFVDGFRQGQKVYEPNLPGEGETFVYKIDKRKLSRKTDSTWTVELDVALVELYYTTDDSIENITEQLFEEEISRLGNMGGLVTETVRRIEEIKTLFSLPDRSQKNDFIPSESST